MMWFVIVIPSIDMCVCATHFLHFFVHISLLSSPADLLGNVRLTHYKLLKGLELLFKKLN